MVPLCGSFSATLPTSLLDAWTSWGLRRGPVPYPLGHLLIRAICWAIWAELNQHIFSFAGSSVFSVICKIDHLIIAWIDVASDFLKAILEKSISGIKHSMTFVRPRVQDPPPPLAPASEPVDAHVMARPV